MKKISLLFTLMSLAFVTLFTSCSKEDDPKPAPTINFLGLENGATVSVEPGDSVKVEWVANKGGSNLKAFDLLQGNSARFMYYNNGEQKTLSGNARDTYQDHVYFYADDAGTYTFRVTDSDDQTAEVKLTVTEKKVMKEYTAKLVGAQNSSSGSYFASSTGEVLLGADARSNPSIVDITFAEIGSPAKPELISPDAREDRELLAFEGTTTYFAASGLSFEDATDEDLAGISAGSAKYIQIEEGKTYSFVNAAGKKGLIEVVEYTAGTNLDGSITINVKVQP